MTKSIDACKVTDTVEIVPAMIEAGVEAFCGFYPDSCEGGAYDRKMVLAILKAAMKQGKVE